LKRGRGAAAAAREIAAFALQPVEKRLGAWNLGLEEPLLPL